MKTAGVVAKEASKLNPIPMERTSFRNDIKHKNNIFTETLFQQWATSYIKIT